MCHVNEGTAGGPHDGLHQGEQALAVSIRGLTHTYANGKRAVCDLTLDIAQGECFGLLGPNGAGKTTALGVLSGGV